MKPGLAFNRGIKRKYELDKKKKAIDPKKRMLSETEARSSGLEKAIEEGNKGFQMLKKNGIQSRRRDEETDLD